MNSIENITESQLLEVFDSKENKYSVVNIKPKDPVPQTFLIKAPGNENLVLRLVSGKSNGDSVKKLTASDKVMHVYLMSLSLSGNEVRLQGGLGDDPLGTISTIFDIVFDTAKRLKIEAILFRFSKAQSKGKEKSIQRVLDRLIMSRSGGKYLVVDEIQDMGKKYAYVLAKAKSKPSDEIVGLPKPDKDDFKAVNTRLGDVYVDDKTGKQVSKDYAVASAIVASAEQTNSKSILKQTKINRRDILSAQFSNFEWKPGKLDSEEFTDLIDSPPIFKSNGENVINMDYSRRFIGIVGNMPERAEIENTIKTAFGPEYENFEERNQYLSEQFNNVLFKDTSLIIFYSEDFLEVGDLREDRQREIVSVLGEIYALQKDISENKLSAQDAIKKVISSLNNISGVDPVRLNKLKYSAIKVIGRLSGTTIESIYRNYAPDQYNETEKEEINNYTTESYEGINAALYNGDYDYAEPSIRRSIQILDRAFESGVTLPKNTVLYRSQSLQNVLLNPAIQNKIFYFNNYVSASLKPIIYNMYEFHDHTDHMVNAKQVTQDTQDIEQNSDITAAKKVAWIIYGSDKIKTILPGVLSDMVDEAEVILPRGLTLKITDIASDELSYIFESDVISPDLLENSEIYDGDLLISEGRVEKITSNFAKFKKNSLVSEAVKFSDNQEILQELLKFIDFDDIPKKFK